MAMAMYMLPALAGSLLTLRGAATACALLLALVCTRLLLWAWWRPRAFERRLRAQGLAVSPYTFLFGDAKETMKLYMEAQASPFPLHSNDVAPRVIPFYHDMKKKHGNMFCIWIGPRPRVILADPELVKDVVSEKPAQLGKPEVSAAGKLLITGLISHSGEKWAKHRRIITPSFHLEKLKRMLPAFSAITGVMVDKWKKLLESSSDGRVEIDVFPDIQNLAADVISRTAFGSSYEEAHRVSQLQNELSMIVARVYSYSMIPGYRFLPTKMNRRMKEIDREVRAILGGLIDRRERDMRSGSVSEDLLGFLMESNMREFEENGKNMKGILSREDVMEECKLFYLAGQDTTGTLLNWTMVMLGIHGGWQEKAREEILQAFGKNMPDYDGVSQLKTVNMILHEVLRLYSPVTFFIRCTEAETRVGDFTLPKGTDVFISTLLMHHDPEFWGPDVLEFKPDRFADGISRASMNGRAFYGFGGGPRICVGQNFALLEAKLAVAMILQRFSFEISSSYVHSPHAILTLQPKYGVQIVFRRLS